MSESRFTPHYLLEHLRDIYFAESTGSLHLSRRKEWRRLFFERGMLALASSSRADENLAPILSEHGAVQGTDISVLAEVPVEQLARDLAASGRVSPEALQKAARESVERTVKGAFRWDGGMWRFEDHEVNATAFVPDVLFTFEVFQRGVQEMANFAPLQEVLLAEDRKLVVNDNSFLPIQSLNLGAEQGYILSRVDGSMTANEVVMVAPGGMEERVLKLLFGYLVLGLVQLDPPPGPGMFSLQELMEGHRGEVQREGEERNRILTFHGAMKAKDDHKLLGVEPGAQPQAIKRAYESLREKHRRDRFSPRIRAELKREIGLIENRLLEAYLHLQSAAIEAMTPEARRKKDEEVTDFEKRKELVKSEAQTNKEENQRLAEEYFLKAKDYFKEGDYFNCIQYCKLAVKFNPEEAPFFSLMADALLHNPDHRWQRLAEESYRKAVDIDPWNADYLVALGQLYKRQGLARRARRHFEKALEILPHHPLAREELGVL